MKLLVTLAFTITCFLPFTKSKSSLSAIDKKEFYQIMQSGKMAGVNQELDLLATSESPEKEGYEGAMIIRKAGLVKLPSERLKLFKKGRIKLETAIINSPDNAEYHFLRLIIQENAPKIVKYNANLEDDKEIVIKTFKKFQPVLQHVIIDYSKTSKILHPQDFQS